MSSGGDMLVHTVLPDAKLARDIAVGEAARHGLQHFDLPRGEFRDGRIVGEKPFDIRR